MDWCLLKFLSHLVYLMLPFVYKDIILLTFNLSIKSNYNVSVSLVNKDDQTIYADYNSVFSAKERKYQVWKQFVKLCCKLLCIQAIVKFKIVNKKDAEIIRAKQEKLAATGENNIFFGNKVMSHVNILSSS